MDYSRGISALMVLARALAGWLVIGAVGLGADAGAGGGKGMLLLRNGNVIEGQITEAGDYYVVLLGSSEIRLAAKDVEAQVATLDEAYELKKFGMFGPGATPHLNLAEWCLRQGLHGRCAEQLVAAMRMEPEHPQIAQLQRRLEQATAVKPVASSAAAKPARPPSSVTLRASELEKAVRALPKACVEKFAAVVQPVLLNRCGANQCHGPNSKAEFRLLRPTSGQAATQRFTQRNLYAALQYIDTTKPDESPLLVLPQKQHGTSLTAVFDKHTQKQLDELKAWVRMTVAAPEPAAPATIPAGEPATLSQAAGQPGSAANPVVPSTGDGPSGVQVMRPTSDQPVERSGPNRDRFVPRDPFDPEIFNRRFGARK